MQIDQYSKGLTDLVYYSLGFRNVLEDHMTYLRTHPDTTAEQVDPSEAYQFEFDFYGLLNYKAVPMYLHHLILRMNDMTNPDQATRDLRYFLRPSISVVARLQSVYDTTDRLNT